MTLNFEMREHKTTLGEARSALQYLQDTENFANVDIDPEEHHRYTAYAVVEQFLDVLNDKAIGITS